MPLKITMIGRLKNLELLKKYQHKALNENYYQIVISNGTYERLAVASQSNLDLWLEQLNQTTSFPQYYKKQYQGE